MQKKFFSSLFLLLVLNVAIKPVWIFAIDRQVQNIVGVAEYGKYFALFNISIIFNFLLDIGLTSYYNQKVSGQAHLLKTEFPQVGIIKIFLGLLYGAALMIMAYSAGITDITLLLLLGCNQFLYSFFIFLRSTITAMQMFTTDAWLSVIDKFLMIIACGTLIYFPSMFGAIDLSRFVILQVITISISIIITLVIIIIKHKAVIIKSIRINKNVFRQAFPFGLIVLLMSAHSRQDGFLLQRIHHNGSFEAGVYAGAFRLLDAVNMVGYLVAAFLLPYISKNFSEQNDPRLTIKYCRNLLLFMSVVIISMVLFMAPEFQSVLYHNNDPYSIEVMKLTIASLIGYSLVQVYGTVLTATGNIGLFVKVSIPFTIANFILNCMVIRHFGAAGCATIAIITQFAYGITLMAISKRKINWPDNIVKPITNFNFS